MTTAVSARRPTHLAGPLTRGATRDFSVQLPKDSHTDSFVNILHLTSMSPPESGKNHMKTSSATSRKSRTTGNLAIRAVSGVFFAWSRNH